MCEKTNWPCGVFLTFKHRICPLDLPPFSLTLTIPKDSVANCCVICASSFSHQLID